MKVFLLAAILAAALLPMSLKAADWSRVVNLEGNWWFSVGDDSSWSNPTTSVADWDKIYVPGNWEQSYQDYNGYAWYRREFEITMLPGKGDLMLFLGQIDDVDETFINGVKVGQSGKFFPDYESAWSENRKYPIPPNLLKTGKNTIAVRVYDEGREGGLRGGDRIGIFYDNDYDLMSLDLSGKWKFSIYREKNQLEPNFDDSKWSTIKVPASWESQGYSGHDGYGWYRKNFEVPASLASEELYLVLGKIDDLDKVYLNGTLIGRTEELDQYKEYNKSNAWRLYRVYPVPKKLLKSQNVLAIEVYDKMGDGGIYEGPVGFVTRHEANTILERRNKNYNEIHFDSFWSIFEYIFD